MKKKDGILIVVILIVILIFFGVNYVENSKTTDGIEVYVDGKLFKSISIDDENEFEVKVDNGYNVIKVHDRGVEVIEASCPDKVCVHTGFITKASQSIVCIPNKVNIKIKISKNDKNSEDIMVN